MAINKMRHLALKMLDKRVRNIPKDVVVPPGGWLATVRTTLGLTQVNLAQRLGIQRQSLADLEDSEQRKTISLARLDEVARAMGARLIYALVPGGDDSYEAVLRRPAHTMAEVIVMRVERTMTLEAQQRNEAEREESVREIADELFRSFHRELWALAPGDSLPSGAKK